MDESWSLIEPEPFDSAALRGWEGLFTQGSGYLHTRGSLEEHLSGAPQNVTYLRRPANVTAEQFPQMKSKWGTFVPGIYGNHPLMGKEMANLPSFLGIAPFIDGERLELETSAIIIHRRALDLRTAVLSRIVRWRTHSGSTVDVTFERFASAARPHLFVQRMTVTCDAAAQIAIHAGIDSDVRTSGYDHAARVSFERVAGDQMRCEFALDTGDQVQIAAWVSLGTAAGETDWQYNDERRAASLSATIACSAGQTIHFEKRSAVTSSFDRQPADLDALLSLDTGFDALLAEHETIWRRRWEGADVIIDGDVESQRTLRLALYHLMRAHPGDNRLAIDPKAYAGDAYRGLYFWDTEMYLLPFFLYTEPERGRMLTDFRIGALDGARKNAATFGYAGARYPWESDADGAEQCPNWQYRDHEVHVTADVVYGLAHAARASDDLGYLTRDAAAVLRETARYWLERIDRRPGDPYPSLLGVMGPDEYAPITSNNAYTNRLVAFALDQASAAAEGDAAREQWIATARTLPIARRADGLVMQCEEFERFAEVDFAALWRDRSQGFASQVSQERLYRSRCLKQADVLLLMMLFPDEFSDEEVRQAWDYYLPYTTHDSSLSPGVHAVIALRLGLMDQAWAFWQRSLTLDLDGGAEEGIHIAAQGMNWQIAVLGFGGLKTAMQADILTLTPRLPDRWARLAFPVLWKGQRAFVEATHSVVTVENRSNRPLEAQVNVFRRRIPAGERVAFEHGRGS
ncbi:MAG: glycoside hydrolase family 65 protein [Anaerolineae bacterium]|nr:glycoside hydrolase family 65 protein [Anaerolineae bacterium]